MVVSRPMLVCYFTLLAVCSAGHNTIEVMFCHVLHFTFVTHAQIIQTNMLTMYTKHIPFPVLEESYICCFQGTFPDPLIPAANSIVCTKNTALLREIFNQSYSEEKPIPFPSKRCRPAISRCNQCLNQLRCKMIGKKIVCLFEKFYSP